MEREMTLETLRGIIRDMPERTILCVTFPDAGTRKEPCQEKGGDALGSERDIRDV